MAEDANNNGIPDDAEVLGYLVYIFAVLMIIGALFARFTDILERISVGNTNLQALVDVFMTEYWPLLRIMSVALMVALIVFIVYVQREYNKVLAAERAELNASAPNVAVGVAIEEKEQEPSTSVYTNKRWEHVTKLISSENEADWKLAVLEADIMLGEMLDAMGYRGESIGEQLKQIEKSDFTTLDSAWEAHKIRNTIAHEGGEHVITQREAQRVVRLFEEVFTEFQFI